MKFPALTGTIKRRLLVNYRAAPETVERLLPPPFRPKLQAGYAVVGICLIRLEHERPAGMPRLLGLGGEHAAHRIAVEWSDGDGDVHDGVYIPRRDTGSRVAQMAGGRVFPVESQAAKFKVTDDGRHIDFSMRSLDGEIAVNVVGEESTGLPAGSCFSSMAQVSAFFELGGVGYSPSESARGFNAIELWTPNWHVKAFDVSEVRSSYFEDSARFPEGSIEFDHALVMRDTEHEWRDAKDLATICCSLVAT
jgi:hypothetical protein